MPEKDRTELFQAQRVTNNSLSTISKNQVAEAIALCFCLVGNPGDFGLVEDGHLATTPMLQDPTNMDVDYLGRIWVAPGVYYRMFPNDDVLKEPSLFGLERFIASIGPGRDRVP